MRVGPYPEVTLFPAMFPGAVVAPPLMFTTELTNFRLCVLAATLMSHGAFDGEPTVDAPGPSFPADAETNIPASRAPRNATAFESPQGSLDPPPIEKLITSTPSAVAWSIANPREMPRQPPEAVSQALYVIRLACGATPETFRVRVIVGATMVAATTFPAAVLAV